MLALNKVDHEEAYNNIMKFYDYAEELIDTVESKEVDPNEQLEIVEPLVLEIEESTEVLAEEYRNFVRHGGKKKPNLLSRKRIETALRNLFLAVQSCRSSSKNKSSHVGGQTLKLTEKLSFVLDGLNKQVERVFNAICYKMQLNLKDYHYSRSGRQEGNTMGITADKNSKPTPQQPPTEE